MLESHNAILVVVDRLSKERHYILYIAVEEGITLEKIAWILYHNV
jgi:hypothetical protein